MFKCLSFGQGLLAAGFIIALTGLVLWLNVPIPGELPPFALTTFLAILGGTYELWLGRAVPKP